MTIIEATEESLVALVVEMAFRRMVAQEILHFVQNDI